MFAHRIPPPASVAQLVEHLLAMQKVVGSTPITRSIFYCVNPYKNHVVYILTQRLDIYCLSENNPNIP